MDMISDIYMVRVFLAEGNDAYANANIAMIGVNWLFQLIVVYFQTGRNIFRSAFLKEALVAAVGLKPGLDAYNVCIGKEQQTGQTFNAMDEVRLDKWNGRIEFQIHHLSDPLS
jgi:hypothetical protein